MNIERLRLLVRGILDPNEAIEALRILSDAKSYTELRDENAKLKQQILEEQEDHAKIENALARARLRAEGERDVALLASSKISEEDFIKRMEMRWNGKTDVPDDALNPLGKMLMKMGKRIKELEAAAKTFDGQFKLILQKYEERDRVVCEQNSYIQTLQRQRDEKGKPESQIQAELLADMHNTNHRMVWAESDAGVALTIRNTINDTAIRHNVYHQLKALLEKKHV